MTPDQRREQYAADITYGTNNEFGFDYLRDNMAWSVGRPGPARPRLRHRRRGRLDPHRRGAHAADHLRARRTSRRSGTPSSRRWPTRLQAGRRLRGRREEAHRRRPGVRHRAGRGLPRHREPLREREHPARRVPQQRHQGQGAVQARQGLRRHRRRGPHRRRAHRAAARRAAATTRACTRPSRPRRASRSRARTRRSRRSRCRTTSGCTTSSPGMTGTAQTEAAEFMSHLQARRRPDPDEPADDPRWTSRT